MATRAGAVKFELVDDGNYRKARGYEDYPGRKAQRQRAKHRRERKAREWLKRYKAEHPCSCGESDPACLDFHHLGQKNREMSRAKSMSSILREIPYCVVMCANCHRKTHKERAVKPLQLGFRL